MSRIKFIRTEVFRIKQNEMAKIAMVSQATLCKWENGKNEPVLKSLNLIREEAIRRGIQWDDAWFFGGALPVSAAEEVA